MRFPTAHFVKLGMLHKECISHVAETESQKFSRAICNPFAFYFKYTLKEQYGPHKLSYSKNYHLLLTPVFEQD